MIHMYYEKDNRNVNKNELIYEINKTRNRLANGKVKNRPDQFWTYACPECGFETFERNSFCTNCGSKQDVKSNEFNKTVQFIHLHSENKIFKKISLKHIYDVSDDKYYSSICSNSLTSLFVILSSTIYSKQQVKQMIEELDKLHIVLKQVILTEFKNDVLSENINELRFWKGYYHLLRPNRYLKSDLHFAASLGDVTFKKQLNTSETNYDLLYDMGILHSKGELKFKDYIYAGTLFGTELYRSAKRKHTKSYTEQEKIDVYLKQFDDKRTVLDLMKVACSWRYSYLNVYNEVNPTKILFFDLIEKCQLSVLDQYKLLRMPKWLNIE